MGAVRRIRPAAVARRALAVLLVLVATSAAIFSLLQLAPGSAEAIYIGTRTVSEEQRQALRERFGLDEPVPVQYVQWLGRVATLDLGTSTQTSGPVAELVASRASLTFQLVAIAFPLALVLGIGLGTAAALRRDRAADRTIAAASILGVSTPAFVSGVVLIYAVAVLLGLLPTSGEGEPGLDRLRHLALPAVTLALSITALLVRLTRAGMLETLEQDYVAFAVARGLGRRRVLFAYALRNALIPVIAAAGNVLVYMVGGAVLVEVTFDLPGLGSLLVSSVTGQDIPVVQAVTLLVAALVLAINAGVDALYRLADPRLRQPPARP